MIGRAAYHDPGTVVAAMDTLFEGKPSHSLGKPLENPRKILESLADYAENQAKLGVPFKSISRHLLGLFNGMKGAKAWRRHISENAHLPGATPQILLDAYNFVEIPESVDA
jgi:tRNA-dihydrouridine synthase A